MRLLAVYCGLCFEPPEESGTTQAGRNGISTAANPNGIAFDSPGLTGSDPQTQGRPAGAVQPWATVWNPFRIRECPAKPWATAPPCVRLSLGPLAKRKGVANGFTEDKTSTHSKQRGAANGKFRFPHRNMKGANQPWNPRTRACVSP